MGFHDPIWRIYFSDGWLKHQLSIVNWVVANAGMRLSLLTRPLVTWAGKIPEPFLLSNLRFTESWATKKVHRKFQPPRTRPLGWSWLAEKKDYPNRFFYVTKGSTKKWVHFLLGFEGFQIDGSGCHSATPEGVFFTTWRVLADVSANSGWVLIYQLWHIKASLLDWVVFLSHVLGTKELKKS